MKIGFIGLGNMGLPMAINIKKAGFEVYGKNRSAGKEEEFKAQGGKTGLTLSEMASQLDIIVTCLPMPADVEEVYTGEEGLLNSAKKGLILIDCSTVSPGLSRNLYEQAMKAGAEFLDAPVSGGTTGAAAGTLSIMVGGREPIFQKAKPVLEAMGKQIYFVGDSGNGTVVKLINQLMVGIHSQAVAEAYALSRSAGLDNEMLFSILNNSFAQSRIMERHYSQFIAKDTFLPGFAMKLLAKDMNLAMELADSSSISLDAAASVQTLLKRAVQNGFGDLDMSGLYQYQLDREGENKEKLKHFAVFLPMLDADKSVQYRAEHLRFLDERRAAGMLHANGRFADGSGGLVIYRTSSYEETENWVKQDPYIVKGARNYEIHEWDIVLADR
ncbi:NAD(P)-dependent oxidoreductase [Paenibacillus montanisoli]|uniref:NAD(P)-dependent oxidoreductase n=1 Tax=Paenibacillus montanisoli TaxID=2081970 RepID=A0A328U312_9BACL|nr:NAD(P)-dependent oxidoreductase [Paenibacillus montanisoli]